MERVGLVSRVGRRSWRSRAALGVLYGVLSIGALTTLTPFLLMISGGMRGATDLDDSHLVPEFWSDLDSKGPNGLPAPHSLMGKYLADKYGGDLSWMESLRQHSGPAGDFERQVLALPVDRWSVGFRPASGQVTSRLSVRYQTWLRGRYPSIEALNAAYVEENTAFQTVQPPAELLERLAWTPPKSRKYQEWLEFKAGLPAEFRVPIYASRLYQEDVRARYQNTVAAVPSSVMGGAAKFEAISTPPSEEFWRSLPPRLQFLRSSAPLPIATYDDAFVRAHRGEIQQEFSSRNFRFVADLAFLHGRALWNTAIFCLLAILLQLTVNPIAAYGLSRYPTSASGKLLIFLLATMAFPAEVAMIPSFLLLRDLGLLNTFAALVLPAAASGYMIFLLKGFFDSLPSELFESAQLDGAPEIAQMMKIALPLSKPVLGYLALIAFLGAYGAFFYAFLVAQDQRIWTLMVWVYQLQQAAPKPVTLAAVTLAALPTLAVFLIAQRAIVRGIVLPGER